MELLAYGARRVPGLRRAEVAVLAGVSVPYYTRLERGEINGASEGVLGALAAALRLDEAETAHLHDLARAARPAPPRRARASKQRVRPPVQHILDAITGAAAFIRNDRLDILGGNQLGYALYSEMFVNPLRPVNTARFVFLDARRPGLLSGLGGRGHRHRRRTALRRQRDPHDRALSDLVGQLATQSEAFRARWATHNVRFHVNGIKHFHHPVVGEITLNFERLDLAADSGLTIFTYTPQPGSRDEKTLRLLGSWAATPEGSETASATGQELANRSGAGTH